MDTKYRDLLKVLVSIAWLDGDVAEEESSYLNQMASKLGLKDDPEIRRLLNFDRPIAFQECLKLLSTYLTSDNDTHTASSYNEMIRSIRSLVKSDGIISPEEKAFLQISKFLQASVRDSALSKTVQDCQSLSEAIALARSCGYQIQMETFKEAKSYLRQTSSIITASLITFGTLSALALPAIADTVPPHEKQEEVRQDANLVAADLLDALAAELRGEKTSEAEINTLNAQVNSVLDSVEADRS